jgi:hypothetical protein
MCVLVDGIKFVTDPHGEYVQIDLRVHGALWDTFYRHWLQDDQDTREEAPGPVLASTLAQLQRQFAQQPGLVEGLRSLSDQLLYLLALPPGTPFSLEERRTLPVAAVPEAPSYPEAEPLTAAHPPALYHNAVDDFRSMPEEEAPAPAVRYYADPPDITDEDLPWIARRCRLKAEAARWAGDRERRHYEGITYAPEAETQLRSLIVRAKEMPECFLWMTQRSAPIPRDLSCYDDLAGCYIAAAQAIALLDDLLEQNELNSEFFERALYLAAEAQSSIRSATLTLDPPPKDSDQFKLFLWLKSVARDEEILISRYMRLDDPADPTQWQDLQDRIVHLDAQIQHFRDRGKRYQNRFKQISYHLDVIRKGRKRPKRPDQTHDWEKVLEAIEELVQDGLPPSNRDLRDLLIDEVDQIEIPEGQEPTPGVRQVLREIDRYLATRAEHDVAQVLETPSIEMQQAANLLRGRSVMLIGGTRRPEAARALEEAFDLKELIWEETREHQTTSVFETNVARDDVALVILAIRWSSHSFGDVKQFCDQYDKPLVRLPAGYNPHQVAYHIMQQVADRLGIIAQGG